MLISSLPLWGKRGLGPSSGFLRNCIKSLPRVLSPKDRETVEGCLPGCKSPFISGLLLCKADLRQPRSSQIKDARQIHGTVNYGCAEIRWAEETWDKKHKHLLHVGTGELRKA